MFEIMYCSTEEQVVDTSLRNYQRTSFTNLDMILESPQMIIMEDKCWYNDSFVLSLV